MCGFRATGKLSDIHLSDLQHKASRGWLTRSFASEVPDSPVADVQAKPIKKGLSAGTTPPATDQVPPAAAQQPGPSVHDSHSSTNTADPSGLIKDVRMSSATVGIDRPSAAAVPAGVDQVPPSSTAPIASAQTTPHANTKESNAQTPASNQSMQSVIDEIGDIGQLNKGSSKLPDASIGRWQRFKWWVWGTPQQHWTYQDSSRTGSSTADATHAAASTTDSVGDGSKWQRSKWSIADIIGSAILRSGITKDEDVARLVHHVLMASSRSARRLMKLSLLLLPWCLGSDSSSECACFARIPQCHQYLLKLLQQFYACESWTLQSDSAFALQVGLNHADFA